MAYEARALDATIAAAAGDDGVLYGELRQAFIDSLARQIDMLRRARCDGNWHIAAQRLRSLATSFQADDLLALADRAADSAPGDPAVLRRLREFHDRLTAD